MKKVLALALSVMMAICFAAPAFAASGLNTSEDALLAHVSEEFETKEAGVYVKLPEEFVTKVTNYLSTEGLEITEQQFAAAEIQITNLKAFLKANLQVADGAVILKMADVQGSVYDGLLDCYKAIATAVDASVVFVNDSSYTGRIEVRSNSVANAVLVIEEGHKEVGAGVNMTVIAISGIAVVVALAAVAFVITKKKGKENA